MKSARWLSTTMLALVALLFATGVTSAAEPQSKEATVNGVKLHYLIEGSGPPVVLLHGFAETSHMWLPLMKELSKDHTVIAPDLRGSGDSEKPARGYEKKALAEDIFALTQSLGYPHVQIVGHDIGLMVAYAYAAQHPDAVDRIVLMDAFLPGVGAWTDVWLLRDLWHFHFYGETPLKLVKGRERIYLDHFWNDFAADRSHSIPEADRQLYAKKFAQPGAVEAGFEYFRAFAQDAKDFEALSKTKLTMPMLVIGGEKSGGQFLIDQGKLVANDVQGRLIKGSGHWLMEEAPAEVIPLLTAFLNQPLKPPSAAAPTRLTPEELGSMTSGGAGAGSSGVSGIETTVLKGDPTKRGLYTIELKVPASTTIQSHTHPDDRVATVVSGTWSIGYGPRFDEKALKSLPPGSFYTEPPNEPHFARTGSQPVTVQISGYGPTGTTYVGNRAQARSSSQPAK